MYKFISTWFTYKLLSNMEYLIDSVFIGLWAHIFVNHLQSRGEIFSFVRMFVRQFDNRLRYGSTDLFDEDRVFGIKFIIYKWLTCEKCHAGIFGLFFSLTVYSLSVKTVCCFTLCSIGSSLFFKRYL